MTTPIDLSRYTEHELMELNRRIVERLRSLQQHRDYKEMTRFSLGDTVSFTPDSGRSIFGTIIRANTKTVTVLSSDGQRWRVSPGLLARTTEGTLAGGADAQQGQLIEIRPSRNGRR